MTSPSDRPVSADERAFRLRQLNDLHNVLVNTGREKFCPALRWAMDQLGCPDAAARPLPVVQNNPCAHDWEDQTDGRTCKLCGWQEDLTHG